MTPADLPRVHRLLHAEFRRRHAPIRDLMAARGHDPFRILVATLLSARTRDPTTATVCRRLFESVRTPADLEARSVVEIERLIFPVGFYRTKARHLYALARRLRNDFGGEVPRTIEALCTLPGVGRKTANLVMIDAFDQPAMCVDIHVHRISNRFGLIRTRTPAQSEQALRARLPRRYWKTWNLYLVSHGQTICLPIRPRCTECSLRKLCGRVGVGA